LYSREQPLHLLQKFLHQKQKLEMSADVLAWLQKLVALKEATYDA
jgi:hypothetical protein